MGIDGELPLKNSNKNKSVSEEKNNNIVEDGKNNNQNNSDIKQVSIKLKNNYREVEKAGNYKKNIGLQLAFFLAFLGAVIVGAKDTIKKEDIYNKYREEYTKDLDVLLSDESDVNYEKVAKCIASSDNPDFALSILYDEYDQDNMYPYLTYETSKYLEFESQDDIDVSSYTIMDYLDDNGFKNLDSFVAYTHDEFIYDYKKNKEYDLEDLNVKVKKNTLKLNN